MSADNSSDALISVVTEFYLCENSRDWNGVCKWISPQIVARTYPSRQIIVGRDAFIGAMIEMYRGRDETFEVLSISADSTTSTVHVELVIAGKISVNVFEIQNGLIATEREYLGEGYDES